MTDAKIKKEPKGGLVLALTNDNFVRIGDIEIYFRAIQVAGTKGGSPIVSIRIIAPRSIQIQRCER